MNRYKHRKFYWPWQPESKWHWASDGQDFKMQAGLQIAFFILPPGEFMSPERSQPMTVDLHGLSNVDTARKVADMLFRHFLKQGTEINHVEVYDRDSGYNRAVRSYAQRRADIRLFCRGPDYLYWI